MSDRRSHAVQCLSIQEADDGWVWELILDACGVTKKARNELAVLGMAETTERVSTTRDRGLKQYWRLTPAYRKVL